MSEDKEMVFGLQMQLLPGAKIRFIAVNCMVVSGTSSEQNGGDMNESEFRYRQLEIWLSLRGSKKESLDRSPFTSPWSFDASPCNLPRSIPGSFVYKIRI